MKCEACGREIEGEPEYLQVGKNRLSGPLCSNCAEKATERLKKALEKLRRKGDEQPGEGC